MRKILVRTLSIGLPNCSCIEAPNGEEAVNKYFDYHPVIVIMDLNMPNKNGIEATTEIMKRDPKAKIIILTALDQRWAEEKLKSVGVKAFLIKPFRPEILLDTVKCLIDPVPVRMQNQSFGSQQIGNKGLRNQTLAS